MDILKFVGTIAIIMLSAVLLLFRDNLRRKKRRKKLLDDFDNRKPITDAEIRKKLSLSLPVETIGKIRKIIGSYFEIDHLKIYSSDSLYGTYYAEISDDIEGLYSDIKNDLGFDLITKVPDEDATVSRILSECNKLT